MTSSECEICICLLTGVKVLRPLFRRVLDDKEKLTPYMVITLLVLSFRIHTVCAAERSPY